MTEGDLGIAVSRSLVARLRPFYAEARFVAVLSLMVLLGFSTAFVMPFMSMFGTIEVGMSLFQFGALMTLNAMSGVVVATTLAHYSDTALPRRSVLLVGSLAGALGYAGYAHLRSFVPLLLVGTLVLSFSAVTFSQLFAYARELLQKAGIASSEAAFYINVFRMFIALAWTVGPAVASWVVARFSYRGLFLCASGDLLLFACVVWATVPDEPPRARHAGTSRSESLLTLLARRDILAHFVAFVLISAATTISMMNLPLLILKTLRGTEANVGIAYSVAPFFELPLMLYFGWLATKALPANVIRVGMLISLAYYSALVLFVRAPWHVYPCQALSAAATAVLSGVAITYFQSHLPRHPGTATNLYSNAQRIGSTAGYFLFVALAWRLGFRWVFAACALFAAFGFVLMLVPVRETGGSRLQAG
jgi:SET family sugar efflux transporter-like MFS transporter